MNLDLPEEAVLDAVALDPLGAAQLLQQFAEAEASLLRAGPLEDICKASGLSQQRSREIVDALIAAGAVLRSSEGVGLAISRESALRHAAVLRGAAYANYRHRDSNTVEVTLTPPAHPSRLIEVLPKSNFSWTGLYYTTDSLAELAGQAGRRFVIASPFIDEAGMDWVETLFDATLKYDIDRVLIVRGIKEEHKQLLRDRRASLLARGVRVFRYYIEHDRTVRPLGYESFHAKLLLADDDKAYVGSSNMTSHSLDYSMECGIIVRGPGAKPVAALIDTIISISQPWNG